MCKRFLYKISLGCSELVDCKATDFINIYCICRLVNHILCTLRYVINTLNCRPGVFSKQ